MSEQLFLSALKKAVSQWPGAQLVDYCCAESGLMGKTFFSKLLVTAEASTYYMLCFNIFNTATVL